MATKYSGHPQKLINTVQHYQLYILHKLKLFLRRHYAKFNFPHRTLWFRSLGIANIHIFKSEIFSNIVIIGILMPTETPELPKINI